MFEKYIPKHTTIESAIKDGTHKEFLKTLEYLSTEDSPELRKQLLDSGRSDLLLAYSLFVIEKRWKEAEPTILHNNTNPYNLAVYSAFVLCDRWIEAEPIIMTDAKAMYCYTCDILKKRWVEAEEYWANQKLEDNSKDKHELEKYQRKFQPKIETVKS